MNYFIVVGSHGKYEDRESVNFLLSSSKELAENIIDAFEKAQELAAKFLAESLDKLLEDWERENIEPKSTPLPEQKYIPQPMPPRSLQGLSKKDKRMHPDYAQFMNELRAWDSERAKSNEEIQIIRSANNKIRHEWLSKKEAARSNIFQEKLIPEMKKMMPLDLQEKLANYLDNLIQNHSWKYRFSIEEIELI